MSSRWKISTNKGTPEKVVLSFWTESSKNWKVVFYPNPLMVLCFRGWYIWIKKSRRTIVYKQKISLIFASCLHSLHASHTVWIPDIDWLYNVFSFFSVSSKWQAKTKSDFNASYILSPKKKASLASLSVKKGNKMEYRKRKRALFDKDHAIQYRFRPT